MATTMDHKLQTKMVSDAVSRILESDEAHDTIHNIETGNGDVVLFGKNFTASEAESVILTIAASVKHVINQTSMINQAEFHCALADVSNEINLMEEAKPTTNTNHRLNNRMLFN